MDEDENTGAAAGGRGGLRRPETVTVPVTVKGVQVPFEVAPGTSGPIFISLGVRKSGSTLLHKILSFLSAQNGVNIVDVAGTFFRKGLVVGDWAEIEMSDLLRPGNIYTGFRAFPPAIARTDKFRDALKVFMFRDPRDALVSQYFSDAYSHAIPSKEEAVGEGREIFLRKRQNAREANIDDYVLKHARNFGHTLERYAPLLNDPNCLVLRYEDFVFQKRRLVHKVLQHFGWTLGPKQLDRLMEMVDQVPNSEDKTKFVRKAVPGDHRVKLAPETIAKLDEDLHEVMRLYDYY